MRRNILPRLLSVFVVTVILAVFTAGMAQGVELALMATLEMPQAKFKADDKLTVTYHLKNASEKPITVLKWNTPLEGFMNNIFKVIEGGEQVMYIGPMVKRAPPTPDDYVELAPGETIGNEVNLADAYAIYDKGSYQVQLRYDIFDAGREKATVMAEFKVRMPAVVPANAVSFELLENRPEPKKMMSEAAAEEGIAPTFTNCSAERQDELKRALSSAVWLSGVADTSLLTTPMDACPGGRRYVTWFGSYTKDYYLSVTGHFDNIVNALTNKPYTFDCGCDKQNVYAYVYANKPYTVYLCEAFWTAPMTGTDSKAGTLIHETSHFYVVAGTKDYKYGQANCKKLAQDNPGEAANNADSHEYYAEDTPPIPMP